jgi:probable rRNA maturation factor
MAIGDVIVCPEVARVQAEERGIPLDDELALLVVHGTLHIFGYDHAEPEDEARMERRERELLGSFAAGEAPRPTVRGGPA